MRRVKEDIIRLRAEGKTYDEIRNITGASKATIAYHVGEGQKQKFHDRTTRRRTLEKRVLRKEMEDAGCIDCGEKYPHYMLQFDHLPGYEKVGSPTQLLHIYGWDRAREEMKKCEVVCANCHCIRTYVRGQNGHKD
jgi:hypothetical protein